MKKEKLAIIDANALAHRAFHALPPLMNREGALVNAVYGFATILLRVLKDIRPDYIAICFDISRETFRSEMYAAYKAQREAGPRELYNQMAMIKELLAAFNMSVYEKQGFEADDLIGTITKIISEDGKKNKEQLIESYIVTGDLDTLQLIDEKTKVYTLKKGMADTVIYNEQAVREKYGFGPDKVVDYKALRGDPSDNIPGVRGIGEKTAIELIKTFDSLENLYDFVESAEKMSKQEREKAIKKKKMKESVWQKLVQGREDVWLSKKLAKIVQDVPLDFQLIECRVKPFSGLKVVELFQKWNFKSLITKIPAAEKIITKGQSSLFPAGVQESGSNNFSPRAGYELVNSQEKWDVFMIKIKKQSLLAIDTETNGLDPFTAKLIGISFSFEEGKGYYLARDFWQAREERQRGLADVIGDARIKKIGHNIKFDLEVLAEAGFQLGGIFFDTMIASYLLNPGTRQHNLDALAFAEFGYEMTPIEALIGKKGKDQLTMDQIDQERVADYAIEDADYTKRLYDVFSLCLEKNGLMELMSGLEMPLVSVLARMEKNGVKINGFFLRQMSQDLNRQIRSYEKEMFFLAGKKFNPRSPSQIKEVLFDRLHISTAGLGRIKTGVSTAAAELEKLRDRHPIVKMIEDHRELSKLKSTYTDALPLMINKQDGRIHTSFNQTVTATGRLSSSEPNLQNIPVKTSLGRRIRQAFQAPEGFLIVSIDYSQIELRIAAALSKDKKMHEAFVSGEDIHARTAAEIFEVALEKVNQEMRSRAKEVNFGILYGLGPRGLAQRTGVSYDEALAFIDKYFQIFRDLKEYLEETIAFAHENEYVETLFGRRRNLPEINATHSALRAAAERMAVNHPLQGTAADLMKMAMIKVDHLIGREYPAGEVKMILQVHDELVFEVSKELVSKVSLQMKKIMEETYDFGLPIRADVGVGLNWGECQ